MKLEALDESSAVCTAIVRIRCDISMQIEGVGKMPARKDSSDLQYQSSASTNSVGAWPKFNSC